MDILKQLKSGDQIEWTIDRIVSLLEIDTTGTRFYDLLALSNAQSRKQFGDRGYVFTQIGINAEPCPVNCKFCSMASGHYSMDSQWDKPVDTLKEELTAIGNDYFDDFFLMTTADYPQQSFIEIGRILRPLLRPDQKFVANIGDFDLSTARQLKEAGFTGVYHINRLREGIDTNALPQTREASIQAARDAGLSIYYCIEPIGPEHSYQEIAVEILRAVTLGIEVMAVMRRIAVPGTPLYNKGMITAAELTKIVAVTNLVVKPTRAMNVHEPTQAALLAGVNQLYAEIGANPRDTDSHTENNRGFTIDKAWQMLHDFGYRQP